MKQIFFILSALFVFGTNALSQKFYTKNGHISIFSKASIESIKADNNQVITVLDTQTGEIQFFLLIRNFYFEKALTEQHFNEDFMDSDIFPKAGFRGKINNLKEVSFEKDGFYNISITGNLDIHGVVKKITTTGSITISGGVISASSKFFIRLSEFNIMIPRSLIDNIAGYVELTIQLDLDQKL